MTYNSERFKENQSKRLAKRKGQTLRTNRSINEAAFTRAKLLPSSIIEFVAKIRLDLFGSVEPRFSDIEVMGEWIRMEAHIQPPAEGHAPRYGYRMPKGISHQELKELNEKKPGTYGVEYATLKYPGGDGWQRVVIVSDGTRLRRLWLAVQYIAKELDCQEAQATALILADKLPVVSALSAETPQTFSRDKPSSGKIIITIREPIPEELLIKAYRKLRHALWGDKRNRQPASKRDCTLVEFVMENLDSDNPQWERLMKKWNKAYPEWAYQEISDWRGFRKKYSDAKQKIYPDIHWGDVTLTN
jgi:hypothetical protein